MSISVAISADTSRVTLFLDQFHETINNMAQGLLEAVDSVAIPHLYDVSRTVWNVRTGLYSSSWYSQIIGSNAVRVGNDARNPRDGYPYNASLEWGWTTRGGMDMDRGGVLYPTVYEDLELIAGELLSWLQNQTVM